jgi:hypothetical protein
VSARQFWIIKHGVKASGMPAWGATHDDDAIWAIVAFVQKLPSTSPEEYVRLTTSEGAHEHDHEDADHHHEESAQREHNAGEESNAMDHDHDEHDSGVEHEAAEHHD